MASYANIIVDISHEKVDKTFQYEIPEELLEQVHIGVLVTVPFGNRSMKGYVIEVTDQPEYDVSKIKPIRAVEENGIAIESQLIELAVWMRRNYGATLNHALKTVIPIKQKYKEKEKRSIELLMSEEDAKVQLAEFQRKHSTARARLLEAVLEHHPLPYQVVTQKLGVTASVVRALEERAIIQVVTEREYRNPVREKASEEYHLELNEEQQSVVDRVLADFNQDIHRTYLLHGVTGSGKTEVYMELIAHAIARGKQAIVLIPEIALTYQTVMRFYRRFGDRVSIMNSKLSPGERFDQFTRARNGEIDVMIGPRSALFTPFQQLGIIIIDEEHESSYKSETLPKYHARETAIKRAEMAGASVVLGSATPSVESYYKAKQGCYELLELKKRVQERPLPQCYVIDLREELRNGNRSILSDKLQELMEDRLAKKQQMMLFINRRGMSGFVSCRACGHVIKCPHCDVSLSQHSNGRMICHYCGYEEPSPQVCPECGSKYISGFKAGTQKIEMLVKKRFPQARVLRMDTDTTRNKDGYEKILSAFSNQEADILIGTQMIVKGHDFPHVTLVGVLAADMSLNISDYHAAERTFQLLTQAAGRAGRGEEKGEVVIQTYNTEHYSIQTAKEQNYEEFYEQEMMYRTMLRYPPVWNMLVILVSSKDEMRGMLSAEVLKKSIEKRDYGKLQVIGPASASIAKVNDIYKKVIYLKHAEYDMLVQVKDDLEQFMEQHSDLRDISVQFDFNPMSGF